MKRTVVLLVALMAGVILLRVIPIMTRVMPDGGPVSFLGVDPYYHMRLADHMLATGGGILHWDAFGAYPDGVAVGYRPLLTLLIYWGTWLGTLGAPTQQALDVVGAWMPPILGMLIIIPVYGIGKELTGSRLIGFMAAAFVGLLPSELFHRTLLGFTDHHALETLLTTTAIYFLLRARRQPRWALGAGLAQAALYAGWHGAAMLTAVVCAGFSLTAAYRVVRRQPVGTDLPIFLWYAAPVLVLIPLYRLAVNWTLMDSVGMVALAITALWLAYLRYTPKGNWHGGYIAAPVIAGLGIGAVLVFTSSAGYGVAEEVWRQVRSTFWGFGSTIVEAQPTLFVTAWQAYGFLAIVVPFSMYYAFRYRLDGKTLLWFMFVLAAALGQRRWNYIAVVPVSILSVYAMHLFAEMVIPRARPGFYVAMLLVVFMTVFPQFRAIMHSRPSVDPVWDNSMAFLREQTEEPFGDGGAYYNTVSGEPAYGVLSWWDYGHFIIRMGHRVPVSSPTWQEPKSQKFLMAQTPEEAEEHIAGMNIRYVLLTQDEVSGKFPAIAQRLGYIEDVNAWQPAFENAQMVRMWQDRAPGWKLAYSYGFVRIYERKD